MSFWQRLFTSFSRGVTRAGKEGAVLDQAAANTPLARALELAAAEAKQTDYPWRPPISAQLLCHAGRPCWFVRCNAGERGSGMLVVIEDETQNVVRTQVQPR